MNKRYLMILVLLSILIAHAFLVEAALADTIKNNINRLTGAISSSWSTVKTNWLAFFTNTFIIAFVLYVIYRYIIRNEKKGAAHANDNTFVYIVIVGLALFIGIQIGGTYLWKHPKIANYTEVHFLVNVALLSLSCIFLITVLGTWSDKLKKLSDKHNSIFIVLIALFIAASLQGLLGTPAPSTQNKYIWEMNWFMTAKTSLFGDPSWSASGAYGTPVNGVTVYCANLVNGKATDCAVFRPPHLWVLIGASLLYYFAFHAFIKKDQQGSLGNTTWTLLSIYLGFLAARNGLSFDMLVTFGYYVLIIIFYRAVSAGGKENVPLAGAVAYGIVNTLANTAFKSFDAAPGPAKYLFGGNFALNALAGFIGMWLLSNTETKKVAWSGLKKTGKWVYGATGRVGGGLIRRLRRRYGFGGPPMLSPAAILTLQQQQQLQQNLQSTLTALQSIMSQTTISSTSGPSTPGSGAPGGGPPPSGPGGAAPSGPTPSGAAGGPTGPSTPSGGSVPGSSTPGGGGTP